MYRRTVAILLAFLLVGLIPATAFAAGSINTSQVGQGLVVVEFNDPTPQGHLRVTVENTDRQDERQYTYYLHPGVKNNFPLQMGRGQYRVTVLEHIEDNLYRPLERESFAVEVTKDDGELYLQSVQNIPWDGATVLVAKARELATEGKGDEEQFHLIHNYIVENMAYDCQKVDKLSSDYLPDVEKTLHCKKGICYDFASLLASMLRSRGIPTKLVMGYGEGINGYHAWNEVCLGGCWQVVDVTCDIQYRAAGQPFNIFKNQATYEKTREY
ncbi:MAG: transglutaminase domain-containing protein [Firmicutes bacterium]|nr:transglutaminase domain-containing protein [Bacillota bacterium]